jgi:hypothetical protein
VHTLLLLLLLRLLLLLLRRLRLLRLRLRLLRLRLRRLRLFNAHRVLLRTWRGAGNRPRGGAGWLRAWRG